MKPVLALAAPLVVATLPQLAAAKLACYPLTQIEQALDAEYGETRQFAGHETTGIEYRLYVNAKTGSWSWVGIPTGTKVGCLIFAGRAEEEPRRTVPPTQPAPPPAAQF